MPVGHDSLVARYIGWLLKGAVWVNSRMSRVAGVASVTVLVVLLGFFIYSQFFRDSDSKDRPPLNSPVGNDSQSLPGEAESVPELAYAIESPVLECRGRVPWLTVVVIGPPLRSDTVLLVSPLSSGPSDSTFNAVGGLRSVDASVTTADSAADVYPERSHLFDEDFMATTIEAELSAFIAESDRSTFQVLLLTGDASSEQQFMSSTLQLDVASTQCR